jgi:hypothetical protein
VASASGMRRCVRYPEEIFLAGIRYKASLFAMAEMTEVKSLPNLKMLLRSYGTSLTFFSYLVSSPSCIYKPIPTFFPCDFHLYFRINRESQNTLHIRYFQRHISWLFFLKV